MHFNIEVKVVMVPIQFNYNLNNEISCNSFLLHNYYYCFCFLTDFEKFIKYLYYFSYPKVGYRYIV